jgi:hypothetical protein
VTENPEDKNKRALRRSERALLKIPIQVAGKDSNGNPFTEKTFTQVINRNGARITLKSPVRPGLEVIITNLQTQRSCPFRVVSPAEEPLRAGCEWGVECQQPWLNFWGIVFPELASPPDNMAIHSLLECLSCHLQEMAQLTPGDYRIIAVESKLSRDCPACQKATLWGFALVEGELEELSGSPVVATSSTLTEPADRRRARRLTIKLPVRVRLGGGLEEIGQTENLSKTGLCFVSSLKIEVGDRVFVTVGYGLGATEIEIPARVVRRQQFVGQRRAVYGASLERALSDGQGLSF